MTSPDRERDDDGSVDVEAAWADIVAHWDETGTPPFPRVHSEDVPDPERSNPADEAADVGGTGDAATAVGETDGGETDGGADGVAGDLPEVVEDDGPEGMTDEASQPGVRPGAVDDRYGECPPDEPLSLAGDLADDLWDDEWAVPQSHVGGEPVRRAGERDADMDEVLDDEGYEPPEPPPLPRGDVVSRFAWSGVLGAPLFFLFAALFWHTAPTWLVVGAVGAFVAGFVTLVVRMPDSRDDDDDGAVV